MVMIDVAIVAIKENNQLKKRKNTILLEYNKKSYIKTFFIYMKQYIKCYFYIL